MYFPWMSLLLNVVLSGLIVCAQCPPVVETTGYTTRPLQGSCYHIFYLISNYAELVKSPRQRHTGLDPESTST